MRQSIKAMFIAASLASLVACGQAPSVSDSSAALAPAATDDSLKAERIGDDTSHAEDRGYWGQDDNRGGRGDRGGNRSIVSPGDQASLNGAAVALQLVLSRPSHDSVYVFAATGLPTGLAISDAGLISGNVAAPAGVSAVTVTAREPGDDRAISLQFNWTVSN